MSQTVLVKDVNRASITPHSDVATGHIKAGVLEIDIKIYTSQLSDRNQNTAKRTLYCWLLSQLKTGNMKLSSFFTNVLNINLY